MNSYRVEVAAPTSGPTPWYLYKWYYVVATSKASASRQAKAMAGWFREDWGSRAGVRCIEMLEVLK
jgi:hypothetical protein